MARCAFRGLVPWLPVTIYRRHLPHWRQAGATYFVTFRLADSIPAAIAAQWTEERRLWCEAHGLVAGLSEEAWQSRYARIPEPERRAFERSQARRLLWELDRCHGSCVLRDPRARACVQASLRHGDGQRYQYGDGVIMPNHVHWLVMPLVGNEMERILQSIKRFVSTELGRLGFKAAGALWQAENYDHIVRDRGELGRIRTYIERNPVQAMLHEGEYSYWRVEWLDEDEVRDGGGTDFRPT